MHKAVVVAVALVALAGFGHRAVAAPPTARPKSDRDATYRSQVAPFLKKHCTECHGPDAQEGDVRFDGFKNAVEVAADRKIWERTIQMLRSGAMPPEDSDQPSDEQRRAVVHSIEKLIYNFDC